MGAPTMADVARLAGVSKKTVSNYVNGYPYIRPDTRPRIEAAVSELTYKLNISACNLSSRSIPMLSWTAPWSRCWPVSPRVSLSSVPRMPMTRRSLSGPCPVRQMSLCRISTLRTSHAQRSLRATGPRGRHDTNDQWAAALVGTREAA